MKFTKRNYIFMVLSIILMCIIFWFSSKDATGSTEQSDFFITVFLGFLFDGEIPSWLSVLVRKAAHYSVYASLGFCLYFTVEGSVSNKAKTFWYPLIASAIYAVSDEIHQMFVPGRAGRLFDLMVDTSGAACGIGIAIALLVVIRMVERKRSCR